MLNFIYAQVTVLLIHYLICVPALTMEGISLVGEKEYLLLQKDDSAFLECKYSLQKDETAKTVVWYHDDLLSFTWGPPEPSKVGEGLKEDEVSLTRDDGHLEFIAVNEDLAGKYRCEVTTSSGETSKSSSYQLLIIDMPDTPDTAKYKVDACEIQFSWDSPAVKPKPDIMCGVWSAAHGYILIATKWMATPYYNGSVSYHLVDEIFEIQQMPLDAIIRCEIKITKIDDSEVVPLEKTYNFTEVWERGCHPLEVGEGVMLEYDNERLTCHAEISSKDDSAPVIGHVKCQDGYEPKYRDFVTSVDLVCKGTRWDIGDGLTWNHFDNLLCVKKPVLPPQSPSKEEKIKKETEEEITSSVNGLITPWVLIFILGLSLISGAIWGLRSQPKKKDPRFMA